MTPTYGGVDRLTKEITQGECSKHVVVRGEFVLSVPNGLDLSRAAPLLCAGITAYSPLRTWDVGPGSRVGVIGLGDLGHMAVKLAVGLGAMSQAQPNFDLIIDTVPVRHDVTPYMSLLDVHGALVVVGQIGPIDEQQHRPDPENARLLRPEKHRARMRNDQNGPDQ